MDRDRAVKYLQSFEKYGSWVHVLLAAAMTLFSAAVLIASLTASSTEFRAGALITMWCFVSANFLANSIQSRRIGTAVRCLKNMRTANPSVPSAA
jgi:hypothetical protein